MHYLLRNRDSRAARQLIFIGEQNNVRDLLDNKEKQSFEKLFSKYGGAEIITDANEYLENYRNIVRLIGRLSRTWASKYCCTTLLTRVAPSSGSKVLK